MHWTTSGRAYVGAYSAPLRTTQDHSGSPQAAQGSLGQPRAAQEGTGRAEGRGGTGHHRGLPVRAQGRLGLTSQRLRKRDRSHGLCSCVLLWL